MDSVSLSPANQAYVQQNKQQVATNPQNSNAPEQKKNGKKLLIAGAAATAAIVAGIMIYKGKQKADINKANEFFSNLVDKAKKGHNAILSDEIQKQSDAVDEFIGKNPDEWEKLKKNILGMLDIKNSDEVLPDGVLYHGTSVKSAKNILENGVTPFSVKRSGSGSGMGYGFYSTPDLKAAQFYSNGAVVLPFKLDGKVATMKEGVEADKLKTNVMAMVINIIDPPKPDSMFHFPNETARHFADDNQSYLVTRAMQELGIDAIYTAGATSRGGFLSSALNQAPEFLDNAGQVAVFNGDAVRVLGEKAKDLNQINKSNLWIFKDLIK